MFACMHMQELMTLRHIYWAISYKLTSSHMTMQFDTNLTDSCVSQRQLRNWGDMRVGTCRGEGTGAEAQPGHETQNTQQHDHSLLAACLYGSWMHVLSRLSGSISDIWSRTWTA